MVVWDRKHYLKKSYKRIEEREMYEKVPNEPSVLVNTIMKAFEKIRLRSDLPSDILNYFLVKNLKISRFYLISKIHKCLHNVPDR